MNNKFIYLPLVILIQAGLFWGPLVSPAFTQKAKGNAKKYKVEILPLDKKVQKIYQLKLVHPYSFRLKTIQKCLIALKYKKKIIFNVQQGRIFNNDLVKRLAPLIQDKFNQVNSNQRVSFKISNPSGAIYLQGDTFLTPEGLHWRLTALRGVQWGIEDFSVSGEPWVLVLQKGQIYKQRYWKGSKQVAQDIVNWVIFENTLPSPSRKLPEPTLNPAAQIDEKLPHKPTVSDIKKRLHLLEQLREENVLTEKEYVRKRKEIIGGF